MGRSGLEKPANWRRSSRAPPEAGAEDSQLAAPPRPPPPHRGALPAGARRSPGSSSRFDVLDGVEKRTRLP